jgi:hypothetical protein
MTTLKGWISTTVLVAMFMISASGVNAGIVVGNLAPEDRTKPCMNPTEPSKDIDWGIILGNLGGILVGQFAGGIVISEPAEDCGIIIGE